MSPRIPDTHAEAWAMLPWLANGRLEASDREWVEAHVAQCADCRAELDAQRKIATHIQRDASPNTGSEEQRSFNKLWARIEQACGGHFDSVLANLYRDGNDSMGWHSDDEPELGPQPLIASLSLGAERRFRFRRRRARGEPTWPGDTLELRLPHGSLLRMAGDTQRLYRHDLPKMRAVVAPRINLTFRRILVLRES